MVELLAEYSADFCIRGYHQYKEMWEAAIGEHLCCIREPTNAIDRYAVAVVRSGVVVGHLPKKISRVLLDFFEARSTIILYCIVTNAKRYSADLPQGGLEVPCVLHFLGKKKE